MSATSDLPNLLGLISFLEKVLNSTNITNKVVSESCNDVRKVLKDWSLPVIQDDKATTCTCFESRVIVNDIVEDEEISKDIDDVLVNAQKVREELGIGLGLDLGQRSKKLRLLKPKESSSFNNVSKNSRECIKLCSTGLMQACKPRPSPNTHVSEMNGYVHNVNRKTRPISNIIRSKSTSVPSSTYVKRNTQLGPRPTLTGRKQSASSSSSNCASGSRPSMSAKSTYQNDFGRKPSRGIATIQANRPYPQPRKNKTITTGWRHGSDTNFKEKTVLKAITMTELDTLLNRVSINDQIASLPNIPVENEGVSDMSYETLPKQVNDNCLIHGKAASVEYVSTTAVNFTDAIDKLGVPPELVKVLKSYHSYVNKVQYQHCKVQKENKASQFLRKINRMNENHWSEAMHEPAVSLFAEYSTLYAKMSKNVKCSQNKLEKFQTEFESLEKKYRKCTSQDATFVSGNKTMQCDHTCQDDMNELQDLTLAGIWNEDTLKGFKGIQDILCIRYNSEPQLQTFQETIQHSQSLQYQTQILELLHTDIIPQLEKMEPSDVLFAKLVKIICALCKVRKFTLPILIKSPQTEN